jgi:hypothetical protein
MRAIVSVLFVLLVLPGAVHAQPGQTPAPAPMGPAPAPDPSQPMPPQPYPPPPPGQPQGYPPQGYPPPPYAYPYGPPAPLTAEEQRLLAEGEISLGQHAGGVAADWFFGFGLGQAIQGRWSDTGWIFTLGEAASFTLIIVGFTRIDFTCDDTTSDPCSNDNAGVFIVGGLISYLGFHAWSIVDAAVGPARHNRKVRELKRRVGLPVEAHRIIPYTLPSHGGGTVGLTFRF